MTAVTTLLGLGVVIAPPAAAAVGDVAKVDTLFQRLATEFLPEVATSSALGQELPTIAASPASSVELADAFSDLLASGGRLDDFSTQTDLADLANYVAGQDGGGWIFTAGSTETSLTVGFTREVQTDTGALDLRDPEGDFNLSTGSGIRVTGTLTGSFTFTVQGDQAVLTAPSLSVATSATLPNASTIDAGLGILGVTVSGATSTYSLSSTTTTQWANPDNDALGVLAYDNPDTAAADDGELAADGAGTGIVTSSRTGTLSGTLTATPRPSALISGLPSVGATVTVSSTTGGGTFEAPDVTATVDAAAVPFLTLSARDLAQGLAQAASSVLAMQNASDKPLPLMRGNLSNALNAVDGIAAFLENSVEDPNPSDDKPGQPSFPSLQDMLDELEDANGESWLPSNTTLDVLAGAAYSAGDKKVAFTLEVARASTSGPLNPLGDPTTGTGNFNSTGVSSTNVDFTEDMVGRKITAAGANATISGFNNSGSVDVDEWIGGVPPDGSTFAVEINDPKTGAPALANALNTQAGIRNANANVSTAQVTQSFTLRLPLVLDLQPATTSDCDPGPATGACPFEHEQGGITQIITELPLVSDRFLLRTTGAPTLLSADVAISSPVNIQATAGFVGVDIGGSVSMSPPASGDTLSIAAVAQGDVPLPAFVEGVRAQVFDSPAGPNFFTPSVGGSAAASLTVSVPEAADFFSGDATTGISIAMPSITAPGTFTVTLDTPTAGGLLKALDFDADDPAALFAGVQALIQKVGERMLTLNASGLAETIPFTNVSARGLLGASAAGGPGTSYADVAASGDAPAMTSLSDSGGNVSFTQAMTGRRIVVGSTIATVAEVVDSDTLRVVPQLPETPADGTRYAVENEILGAFRVISTLTPENLQETLGMIEDSLGSSAAVDFQLVPGTDPDPAKLRLDIDWQRSFGVTTPFALEANLGDFIGAGASGVMRMSASGQLSIGLELPLTSAAMSNPAANVMVDADDTSLGLSVALDASGSRVSTRLGPVNITLGQPEPDPAGTTLAAGFDVTVAHGTGLQTLGAFFGAGMTAAVSDDSGTCSGTDVVCGSFPVVINSTNTSSPLTVSMPAASTLADTFAGLTVAVPSEIQAFLDGSAFKLGGLGAGLTDYMFYLEAALRTASDGGNLPIIGKDLQAGADFLGDARSAITTAFGGAGVPSTAGEVEQFLIDELEGVLPGVESGEVSPELTCDATLPPAEGLQVTANQYDVDNDTAEDYWYAVVAISSFGGGTDTTPSDPVMVTNSDTLTGTGPAADQRTNSLEWDEREGADDGYRIIRSTDGTATWETLDTVAAGVTTYTDDGNPAPSGAYAPETEEAEVEGCLSDTPATQIDGVGLTLTLGEGTTDTSAGCTGSDNLEGTLPLDLGLPGLSLKTPNGGVTGKVCWSLSLGVVLDRTDGFYVKAGSDTDDPELAVGASLGIEPVDGDNNDLIAQLAIIDVTAEKNTPTQPEFAGLFGIDIKGMGDSKLTIAEIAGASFTDAVEVVLTANIDIDWHLKATLDAAIPGIEADFVLTWAWTAADPKNIGGLEIAFNAVTIDTGKFLGEAIAPYLKQILDAVKPMQPVIDIIFTPIPVISDLSVAAGGDEITIATLAQTFSTLAGGPKIEPFLRVIKQVNDLVKNISCTDSACGVTIGSFALLEEKVAETEVNVSAAPKLIGAKSAIADATNAMKAKSAGLNNSQALKSSKTTTLDKGTPGFTIPLLDEPTRVFELIVGGDVPLVEFDSSELKLGFEFQKSFGPVYAPPPVNIVIGGGASVSLRIAAGFDTYGIRRAIETGDGAQVLDSLYFKSAEDDGTPVPVVQFEGYLQAGASVSAVVIEVGVVGGIKLTVGFYWNDPNNDGKFRLFEFATAALRNPICLFNVGGELSLFIKVFITLGVSPFSVSFDFTLVNIKLLDFSLKPDCEPPPPRLGGSKDGVLYLFAGKFGTSDRGDPFWAQDTDKDNPETWVIRQVPAKAASGGDPAEDAVITVAALGITETFPAAGISTVVLDGRTFTGSMKVSFLGAQPAGQNAPPAAPFTLDTVVVTGDGPDVITSGEGDSFIDSGEGEDIVTTSDRTDLSKTVGESGRAFVAGGPDKDTITVGNGDDVVTGDGRLVLTSAGDKTVNLAGSGMESISAPIDVAALKALVGADGFPGTMFTDLFAADAGGNDGDDQIAAGLGGGTLSGNGGADIIGTANDSSQADLAKNASIRDRFLARAASIVGGGGSDRIKSGSAADTIWTGAKENIGEDGSGSGDSGSTNTVDTGEGSDTVYGANGKDFVTTHSKSTQSATVFGGSDADVIMGGYGTDKLYGGPNDDYVIAAPATVDNPGTTTDVLGSARRISLLPGAGPSAKLLVGGTGSDRLYGSDGPSYLFGDSMNDGTTTSGVVTAACVTSTDPVSAPPTETSVAADAADLILGGAGVDDVDAGGGDDWAYTYGANDKVCGSSGLDRLYGGDQNDLVLAGSGADQAFGENHDDQVYGNDGNDTLYGGAGPDRLQGNGGSDWGSGGSEADVVLGGTSKAGRADTGDTLYGDSGVDILVGDNAQTDVYADSPYPTDLASIELTLAGEDWLYGGDQGDRIFGGLENDRVFGGDHDDYAEGNPGSDTMRGEGLHDDLIGGSSEVAANDEGLVTGRDDTGDTFYGGDGEDVVLGDNGTLVRGGTPSAPTPSPITLNRVIVGRTITPYDVGVAPGENTSGADVINGDGGNDVLIGQGDDDWVMGDANDDYAEGSQGSDLVNGGADRDDLVGGSWMVSSGTNGSRRGLLDTGDVLEGGSGDDLAIGDNGLLTRPAIDGVGDERTFRAGTGSPNALRNIALYDLPSPDATRSGRDSMSGNAGVDLLLGQDGADWISGGAGDDYAEGQAAGDSIHGDFALTAAEIVDAPTGAAWSTPSPESVTTAEHGQDDLLGGSNRSAFRDGGDTITGDGQSDFVLGDNGTVVRQLLLPDNSDAVYALRYATEETTKAKVRVAAGGGSSTRFCGSPSSTLCEPSTTFGGAAYGADIIKGNAGDDFLYGQDGGDTITAGDGDDDVYGEMGDDFLFGEAGEDAILGDRGGIRDVYENGLSSLTSSVKAVPDVTYTSRREGTVSRVVDLLDEVNGMNFVASESPRVDTAAGRIPLNGVAFGGSDQIRGGPGADSIHGGAARDLANGDSGGDTVFGNGGDDVLWGGKGADCAPNTPDCDERGTDDSLLDYLFGGKGKDVMDWRPRGSTATRGTTCSLTDNQMTTTGTTVDPCSWLEMTNLDDADDTNNQHHQGVDWMYGGWDRDVMQGDLTTNGPNQGDRLLDWNGAYNLYSHCNAAYGGFNDVRTHSPAMQRFLQEWAYGEGAGRALTDVKTAWTSNGTSAYEELALVYTTDQKSWGSGKAYPNTPGHFDDPNACNGP